MKTPSFILTALLSFLILFNSLSVSFTYAYYELDPIGFIEKLCENKDKPELQCNGKCHLKKVAESNSNSNNNTPTGIIDFKEILLYTQEFDTYDFCPTINLKRDSIEYHNLYTYIGLDTCFHPPKV